MRLNPIRNLKLAPSYSTQLPERIITTVFSACVAFILTIFLVFLTPQQARAQSAGCNELNSSPYAGGYTASVNDYRTFPGFALGERINWSAVSSGNGSAEFLIGTNNATIDYLVNSGGNFTSLGNVYDIVGSADNGDRDINIAFFINNAGATVPSSIVVTASCTAAPPSITSFTPGLASTLGGTSITITGTNFLEVQDVRIGGVSALFTQNSNTQVTATAPAHVPGTATVEVITPGGASTAAALLTYVPPPTITASTPTSGPIAGGTPVVITGTNFSTASAVSIAGSPASFAINSATQITAVTAAGSAGTGDIVVTSPGGSATRTGAFTYVLPPTITANSPAAGPALGGTTVVISGTNLSNANFVSIGGSIASGYTVSGPGQIVATTAAGSVGLGDIIVTTPGGTFIRPNAFTYVAAPTLTSISVPAGPVGGGTTVVITGTNFSTASAVSFGGIAAAGFTIDSATQITATTPAGSVGPADVAVTTVGGSISLPGAFTYVPAPTVSLISPVNGPLGGGTTVVITGTNLSTASAVSFGPTAAGFTINSATQITATAPAGNAGPADIVVTTVGGSFTLSGGFTYVAAPTVTAVSPGLGPTSGGTTVVLTGTDLSTVSAVSFGSTAAAGFTINSATQITVTTPAGSAGPADIVVTAVGGSITLPAAFTYVSAPTITSIAPGLGPTSGGTTVVITGTDFSTVSAVSFGTTAAGFTINSATQITVTTPAGSAGAADVVVTAVGGSFTLPAAFTYVAAPTVTSITPTNGPLGGGTSVVITGTNFSTASDVMFGTTAATSFTINSATQIMATAPAGSAGATDVVVTTVGGTVALPGAFTYVPAPTVTSITPTNGPLGGGTSVVITGTNFSTASDVAFGTTAATGFVINSATQITATAPAGSVGAVDVVVTSVGGSATLPGAFTYVAAPTVTSITPTNGPLGGGTIVVITGTNLSTAATVMFGTAAANGFVINSATQITAMTPAGSVGAVDVVVTTVGGSITLPGGFTYVAGPTIGSIAPASGPSTGGTTVVITGTDFSTASAVSFGTTAAAGFTIDSATQITATTPAGSAGTADVIVTTLGGAFTLPGGFTYVAGPTVTAISPTNGPTSGGTTVVITGTDFSTASAVSFGTTAAAGFTIDSATQITVTTPAGSAGAADVLVTTVGGASTLPGGFTYVAGPTVTAISPTNGPTSGGTTVVITGTDFSTASAVSFGTTAAAGFTINSPTQITATTPAGSAGAADVVVTTAGGSVTLTGGFTYVAAPTLASVSPTNGATGGGTTVVISGTGLANATSVSFGGTAATAFTASATQITATTPAGSSGPVDVVVTTAGGSVTLPGGFTYVIPVPAITSVSPNTGSIAGGTAVTVSGTGLTGASALAFGGTAATSFTVVSDTQISAVTPAHAIGPVDVSVTTPGGPNTLAAGFTYTVAPPTLSSASPNDGSTTGGTTVTIVGTNLNGTNSVAFGVTPAASYTVVSDTQITVVSPAHAAGAVDIVVTTPLGSATLPGAFTFTAPLPTVAGISPNTGATLGGTSVVITGSSFAGATAVSFGGIAASSFVIDSASQITAVTPAHAAGAVNVVVTTPAGSSAAAGAVFTYIVPLRPDPSLDPEVVGLINAQASTATRFARTQMRNFHGRLERLHNERERRAASMDVRLGFPTEKREENAVERLLDQQTSSNAQRLSKTEKSSATSSYGYGTDGVGPISGAVSQGQSSAGGEAEPENSRLAFWSGGFVNFGDREDSGVDIDHTNVGVSGGFDYRFSEKFVAGLGIGFSRDRTDVGNNGTESEAHAFSAAVYGSFEPVDNFFIDGLLGGGTLNFDSRRFVTSTGDFAIGERDGSQVFGSLTAAYELREESWLVSPYARVEFSRSWLDEFTETGGGIYNLTYGKQTVDSFSGILGVRANKAFEMDWGTLRPGVRAEYVHDFDGSSRARLGYADLGGLPYEVELRDKERDYLTLGLSMELQFENNWDLIFDYRAMLDGEGDAEQTVGVQLSVRF